MTYLRSHDRDNDERAAERLRRQFESDATARFVFAYNAIPDYAIFHKNELSAELQKKLAYRHTLGYTDPLALTANQLGSWHREVQELDGYWIRGSTWQQELMYGGPLTPPLSLTTSFCNSFDEYAGVALFCGVLWLIAVLGNEKGEWWDSLLWPPLLTIGAAVLFVVSWVSKRRPERGKLTDQDCAEIDKSIEHISLPEGKYKEYRLASYAAELVGRIAASPAWESSFLEHHRIQFDYEQEIRQIVFHAYELHAINVELGDAPTGNSSEAIRARDHFEQIASPLEVVWVALVDRVAALESFTLNLVDLDVQLENMETARRASGLEGRIGSLLSNAVGDEFAAEHTRTLTAESAYVGHSITTTLDALRDDIAGLTALAMSLPTQYESPRTH